MTFHALLAPRAPARTGRRLRAALAAGVGVVIASGCGSDTAEPASAGTASPEQTATVLGRGDVGDLVVTDAYVVEPANPAVAAAYLVVRNDGAVDDRLVSTTTPVAASVTPMSESGSGGTSRMTDLGEVVVAGGKDVRFERGAAHLMLLQPAPLEVGDTIALTLTFDRAGPVTLEVPVVPVTGPVR